MRSAAAILAVLLGLLLAPAAGADVLTLGSPLSAPAATLDTAADLGYPGHDVSDAKGTYHIAHWGADDAIWNVSLPGGAPAATPQGGQVLSVRLRGCARPVPGYPPLTEIHFQTLAPQAGGAMRVLETSQQFAIPVCGVAGAGPDTVSTFTPQYMCIDAGQTVDFNDAGGFVPQASGLPPYPAGVPYQVLAPAAGASTSSFIRDNGTGNGALLAPGDRTNDDGFAVQRGLELQLQYRVGTGVDAFESCPGGRLGRDGRVIPPPPAATTAHVGQRDGLTAVGAATVSLFCHLDVPCAGTLTVTAAGRRASAPFSIAPASTGHVRVRFGRRIVALARRHHGALPAQVSILTPSAGPRASFAAPVSLTAP